MTNSRVSFSRMPDHDAEMDAIAAQLEAAGYVVVLQRPDGGKAYRLTEEGAQVARQVTMLGEVEQDALLAALLGERGG